MKHLLKALTPPVVWSAAKNIKSIVSPTAPEPEPSELEKSFRMRNQGLPKGVMRFREGMILKCHPESIKPFEHFCFRSPEMVEEMNAFIEHAKRKRRLLDIGALHGIFSIVFAKLNEENHVLAIDASPIAFARLLYNVQKNQLKSVTSVEKAVSDTSGILKMHYEWEHAVAAGTDFNGKEEVLEIEMATCETICSENHFTPDIIKIDVEGHEVKVLRGMKSMLSQAKPMIFLEVHPGRIREEGESLKFLSELLGELNYSAKVIDGKNYELNQLENQVEDIRLILT